MSSPIDNIPFFTGLSAPDLMNIMSVTQTRKVEKGVNLFNQGDKSDGLYVLLSGKPQVYIFCGHIGGTNEVLATLNPGQYVGEFGLIDGEPRSASVSVMESGEILFLPALALGIILDQQPHIADAAAAHRQIMIRHGFGQFVQPAGPRAGAIAAGPTQSVGPWGRLKKAKVPARLPYTNQVFFKTLAQNVK